MEQIRKKYMKFCYHEEDFGICVAWYFFAIPNGKGP